MMKGDEGGWKGQAMSKAAVDVRTAASRRERGKTDGKRGGPGVGKSGAMRTDEGGKGGEVCAVDGGQGGRDYSA